MDDFSFDLLMLLTRGDLLEEAFIDLDGGREDLQSDQLLALRLHAEQMREVDGPPRTCATIHREIHRRGMHDEPKINCASCLTDTVVSYTTRLDCRHSYCHDCFENYFRLCITDESQYPPRCCNQVISLELAERTLDQDLVEEFREKVIEYETVDKTYCSRGSCSAFIREEFVRDDVAVCPKCVTKTCARCKSASHVGFCAFEETIAERELKRLADEEGWRQCFSCNRMVELARGCYHISCLCGHQFCYLCGALWKTCGRGQWDERNIVDGFRPARVIAPIPGRVIAPMPRRRAFGIDFEDEEL